MPSRIDEAGHTKAFDYPAAEHWGESRNVQFRGWDCTNEDILLSDTSHTTSADSSQSAARHVQLSPTPLSAIPQAPSPSPGLGACSDSPSKLYHPVPL